MRVMIVLCTLLTTAAALGLAAVCRDNRLVWDHFDVVKGGILYRSGQLEPEQLTRAVETYGIRTVVSFQIPGAGVEDEHRLARSLGVNFINLPMPGDGAGLEPQFREVLSLLDDPDARPILVHCARGTCRTGAAVGLYRLEVDGWTIEDVADEMRRQAYRDGWLPGYVYAMVKERPFDGRYEPLVRRDMAARAAGGRIHDDSAGTAIPGIDEHGHHGHDHAVHDPASP